MNRRRLFEVLAGCVVAASAGGAGRPQAASAAQPGTANALLMKYRREAITEFDVSNLGVRPTWAYGSIRLTRLGGGLSRENQ